LPDFKTERRIGRKCLLVNAKLDLSSLIEVLCVISMNAGWWLNLLYTIVAKHLGEDTAATWWVCVVARCGAGRRWCWFQLVGGRRVRLGPRRPCLRETLGHGLRAAEPGGFGRGFRGFAGWV